MADWLLENGKPIPDGSHGDTKFVFAGGNPVPNTGVSKFVFESGIGVGGGKILDDFEDNSLSEYSEGYFRDTGSGADAYISTGAALEGTFGLRFDGGTQNYGVLDSGADLPVLSRGMRFGSLVRLDSSDDSEVGFLFAVQSEDTADLSWINAEYSAEKTGDPMGIYEDYINDILVQDTGITKPPGGTVLDFVITWDDGSFGGQDGEITFEIYDGRYDDGGTLVDSVSAVQNGSRTSGGIGYTNHLQGADIDLARIIEDRT